LGIEVSPKKISQNLLTLSFSEFNLKTFCRFRFLFSEEMEKKSIWIKRSNRRLNTITSLNPNTLFFTFSKKLTFPTLSSLEFHADHDGVSTFLERSLSDTSPVTFQNHNFIEAS
jgi:hypothetical protein